MRTRLFVASAAALTVAALGVSAGPSNAQTPSTVFVGVVTVTNPAVAPVLPTPNRRATGPRRTVSCRISYRSQGEGRFVTKRKCRKRYVSDVSTRRTVQTVSVAQPTFVVPPQPTFTVTPPPPPLVVAPPPPVFVVTLAVAPPAMNRDHVDYESGRSKHEKKRRARDDGKERGSEKGKEKGNENSNENSNSRGHDD